MSVAQFLNSFTIFLLYCIPRRECWIHQDSKTVYMSGITEPSFGMERTVMVLIAVFSIFSVLILKNLMFNTLKIYCFVLCPLSTLAQSFLLLLAL